MFRVLLARIANLVTAREILLISATALVYNLFIALQLPTDQDEGYYLTASKLVASGMLPYRDFFYCQMPYLPYLNLPWLALFDFNWYAARVLVAVYTSLTFVVVYLYGKRKSGSRAVATWLTLFVASSTLLVDWFNTAKTYSITTLFLLISYLLVSETKGSTRRAQWLFLAGVLGSLCIGIRLPFLASVAVLWFMVERRGVLALTAGAAVGGMPLLFFFAKSPAAFWFNNWAFHQTRTGAGTLGGLSQKLYLVWTQLGFHRAFAAISFQNILIITLLGLAWSQRKLHRSAFAIALVMVAVNLLPTPTFAQYNCIAVPFVAIALTPWVSGLAEQSEGRRLLGFALGLFMLGLPIGLRSSLGYPPFLTVDSSVNLIRIPVIQHISQEIEAWTDPGDKVMSSWPGYMLEADRPFWPGTENNFPHQLNLFARITQEQANRFAMITDEQLYQDIAKGVVPLVVLGQGLRPEEGEKRHALLLQSGYRPVWDKAGVIIYSKRPGPARPR